MEEAFLQFEVQVVGLCDLKDVVDCTLVISKVSSSCDSNVVHVNTNSGTKRFMFEDDVAIDVVHHGLECRWGVGESKVHDCRFEKSVSGFKCCLLFISFADAYVVVTPSYIKFGVYMGITEVLDEVRDKRKGILVSDGDGVDFSIVLYWSHFAVLFANEEK